MPREQRLAYIAWLPAIQAERTLHERGGDLSTDGFYDAILEMTGSEEQADKLTRERLANQMRAGQQVE